MFGMPSMDMLSPFLGAASPAAGALSAGMDAGNAVADAASSAWDFGSNALANIGGAFDPSMIGGPFMPSMGGGSGGGSATATGDIDRPFYGGVLDDRQIEEINSHFQGGGADATADFSGGLDATADFSGGKDAFY